MQQVSLWGQCLNACVHLKPCSLTTMLLSGTSDKATSPSWIHPHVLYFPFFVPLPHRSSPLQLSLQCATYIPIILQVPHRSYNCDYYHPPG